MYTNVKQVGTSMRQMRSSVWLPKSYEFRYRYTSIRCKNRHKSPNQYAFICTHFLEYCISISTLHSISQFILDVVRCQLQHQHLCMLVYVCRVQRDFSIFLVFHSMFRFYTFHSCYSISNRPRAVHMDSANKNLSICLVQNRIRLNIFEVCTVKMSFTGTVKEAISCF